MTETIAPYRLLVIEDSENIASLICRAATQVGFDACSSSGAAATRLYDSFRPQVIVLDILMPEMDGHQLMQFFKSRNSTARIIILSGSSDPYRENAEKLGMSLGLRMEPSVLKPFRMDEMRKALEKTKYSLNGTGKVKKQHNA